ncbi:puromycin-sensitive aminopeptidase-like isoform X2 [Bolinopsis microptera]|uniref:puromycin-sensitive aminopeptidase-like isoform X2 n=1 Tax=Bolinopsis microptera TaxID=2820187 RepID=UPI00307AC294
MSTILLSSLRSVSKSVTIIRLARSFRMSASQRKPFEHLPSTVVPSNYTLYLHPDLVKNSFSGKETIDVEVKESVNAVKMNSAEIEIQSASFTSGGNTVSSSDIKTNAEDETLTVTFPGSLPLGSGQIHLNFTGILNDKLRGFYRSCYTAGDGSKHPIAVTQFESTDARRAFPCWDEPAIKATFDVTLVSPVASVALSNMPAVKEEVQDSIKITTYDRTPIMSTYLVAFVVGEFDYVEARDKNDVLIRVYTPVGKKEQGEFALDVAVKTLPFYNDYFEIPYPLPKMDLIAIPDFAAGAMENWGLVTYRETALLVDPLNTSSGTKQWVALVVGHELAHQWFGNLVTMQWWTHLWLNEGFASWIEYLCVDHCFPSWDIWLQYVNMDFSRALELDALDNSHPIEVPVGHPEEVDEIFDAISYCKGNSVIRMLHNWLGAEKFRKGLALYLKRHQYKNALTEHLWAALEESSGQPVNKVMSTWTGQIGYPMLTVEVVETSDSVTLNLKQQKFCANGDNSSDQQWLVPVTVVTQSRDTPQTYLLDGREGQIVLEGARPGDWVKVNPNQIGLFRVKYSDDLLKRLLPAVKNQALSSADRLGIQQDLFALAKAGYSSTANLLTLMGSYSTERNYVVLSSINTNLSDLGGLFNHLPCYQQFKAMRRQIFSKILTEVGWENKETDGHTDALLRSMLIGTLGHSGDTEVIEKCNDMFKQHISGGKQIPADIRGSVYSTVRANGGNDEYQDLLTLFNKTDLHEERDRIQRVLGCGPDADLRAKTLDFSLSDAVRSNDTPFVIGGVAKAGWEGRDQTWAFVKNKYPIFLERYSGGFLFQRLVQTTCASFVDMEKYKDVEKFFSENKAPSAERAIKQSLESIKLRAGWLERDGEAVAQWFKDRGF